MDNKGVMVSALRSEMLISELFSSSLVTAKPRLTLYDCLGVSIETSIVPKVFQSFYRLHYLLF